MFNSHHYCHRLEHLCRSLTLLNSIVNNLQSDSSYIKQLPLNFSFVVVTT